MNTQRGPIQVELMSNARSHIILFIAHHYREGAHALHNIRTTCNVVGVITVVAAAGKHTDALAGGLLPVAGIFQCLPRQFQQYPLLRINDFRFLG